MAAALAIGLAGAVLPHSGRAAPAPLELATPLPAWLAPGVSFTVTGWAGSTETVRLLANGQPIGRALSGALGRFELRLRVPTRSGRYRLVLQAGERTAALPGLVVRPVVIAAVGDVNLGDRIGVAIRSYGSGFPWTSAAPLLREADIAVANLECAVSRRGVAAAKMYTFRGDPAAVPAVAKAGIDVVSLANNHSLDFGRDAFLDTRRSVERGGIAAVGGGQNLAAARTPAFVEAGGLRIAFLAYSDIRPLGFTATATSAGVAPADATAIEFDVRRALRAADTVVVFFHWGTELARTPDNRQRTFAAAAFRSGATIVLGAHPHVLQPIDRVGRRLVAWSLGNFVFGSGSPGTSATGVLTVGLDQQGTRWSELVPADIEGVRPALDRSRLSRMLARLRLAKEP